MVLLTEKSLYWFGMADSGQTSDSTVSRTAVDARCNRRRIRISAKGREREREGEEAEDRFGSVGARLFDASSRDPRHRGFIIQAWRARYPSRKMHSSDLSDYRSVR